MGGGLRIDPGSYVAASATVGARVAAAIANAASAVTSVLCGCGAMAGTDPAGVSWAFGYDAAAGSVLAATADAGNAALVLAGLLEQTGFNYHRAENDSAYGDAPPPVDSTDYSGQRVSADRVPSAAGHGSPSPPTGWSLVQHAVGYAWPNGHQDTLRRAADAWQDGAYTLYDAAFAITDAVASIAQQVGPEVDTAISVCTGLRDQLDQLADTYKTLACACTDYAAHLDQAHSQIEHELISLLEWSAGIQVAGAIISAISFGAAEAPTQAEQAERIAATGSKIATIIEHLGQLATTTLATLTSLTTRAADITTSLNPLLTSRRIIATTEAVRDATEIKAALLAEFDRLAVDASVDLSRVPEGARAEVLNALERAKTGKIRFPGHDGEPYRNKRGELPPARNYTEWTAAKNGDSRFTDRVIVAGPEGSPTDIYYWDHANPPVRIGP